ncbi:MAG: phosphodiesterase, partial [Verrucomicrobia bacterium]|nr:phosphodiesterase [Verrucomicrobiota bacterium]
MNRVLLIGWDAADWKVIDPLLAAGEMPNLARLIAGGVRGNLATIYPALSPMVWTSIATGKRAHKHGIHGFSEPLPDGSGVRPITILSRNTKAVWNILNQNGWRSIVVGWWPSHPAEPIRGAMVSNLFHRPVGEPGKMPPLPPGTVHPAALSGPLGDLRVNPMELEGEMIRLFVPDYDRVDQSKDKRLHSLGKIIAETMSVHAAATELLETQPWDFAAVYYDSIDHFGHGFMTYYPPRLPWVKEEDFAVYQHVVANGYRYHDAMLGALLRYADANTTVVLLSDHGFHTGHLRPGHIPAEPAGPAVEHRHFGILAMRGLALRANDRVYGASVLDICPTVLALCGLPPGKDMDGKVLVNAFREPPKVEPIESWDAVAGDAGTHPPEAQLDAAASAEAFKQLVELGYVAPPAADVRETVDETVCELKYNLARAYRDANRFRDASDLLEELWHRWPKEHRFGILLIECLAAVGDLKRRGEAIAELEQRIERYAAEAKTELAKLEEKKKTEPKKEPEHFGYGGDRREQFEERKLRELTHPRPLLLTWFKA